MPKIILLLVFFPLLRQDVCAQKKNYDEISILNLTGSGYVSKLDSSLETDKEIIKIQQFLQNLTGNTITILKTNRGPIFSTPKIGVIINEQELGKLVKTIKNTSVPDIVALIICHEIAHVQQFKNLKNINQNTISRKIWECQADILSGYYYVRYYAHDGIAGRLKNINDNLVALFFYQKNKFGLSNYPEVNQRISAINFGVDIALAVLRGKDIATKENSSPDIVDNDISLFKKDPLQLSLAEAQKITNFSQKASLDIILEDQKVSIKQEAGTIRFSLPYKNNGKDTILVDLSVLAVTAQDEIIRSKKFKKVLSPGDIFLVSDSFNVPPEAQVSLIFPPLKNNQGSYIKSNDRSLAQSDNVQVKTLRNYSFKFSDLSLYALSLDDIISVIYNQSGAFMYGPGVNKNNDIQYHSSFNFYGSIVNYFTIKNKKIEFASKLYENDDYSPGEDIYDATVEQISKSLRILGLTFDTVNEEGAASFTIKEIPVQFNIEISKDVVPVRSVRGLRVTVQNQIKNTRVLLFIKNVEQ